MINLLMIFKGIYITYCSENKIFHLNINIDRCASTKCRDGETCILNQDGDAQCECITQCEDPKDERLMVN